MKKFYLLFLSFVCLCSSSVFANSHYSKNINTTRTTTNCPKVSTPIVSCSKFLCTNQDMNTLFKYMCLSDTQICNAQKIQDKYEQEVLSLNERIQCEKDNLCRLEKNCAKASEIRKQKRLIKKLEKKCKEICKCYEKQFKVTLSRDQQKAYNKYRK